MKNGVERPDSPNSSAGINKTQNKPGSSSKDISENTRCSSGHSITSKIMNTVKRESRLTNGGANLSEKTHFNTKVSASNVKVAFKDASKDIDAMNGLGITKRLGLPVCFNLEFRSKVLEEIYQRHYTRQKLDQIMYIIFIGLVVNLSLVGLYSTVFVKTNFTQVNRMIVTCTFAIINLLMIAFHFFRLFHETFLGWLPYFVWFSIFSQLLVDLIVGYDPLAPSDSVGMFMFFIFITYVILPARMPVCAALSLTIGISHLVVIGVCATKNIDYQARQVSLKKPLCQILITIHLLAISPFITGMCCLTVLLGYTHSSQTGICGLI